MRISLATILSKPLFVPLALLYLKAYLVERRKRAFGDVEILEFAPNAQPDEVASRILTGEPAVVGLSCYAWNVKRLMVVAQRIKELRPDTRIVLGGPEVGPVATAVLEAHPYVDVVVKSEGEIVFADLLDAWEGGGASADVHGICFRSGDEIIDTGDAPILQDLNELPSPHRPEYGDWRGRIICLETQRGCVFRCNFCFYNKDFSIRNRRFDLDRVKQEILFWLRQDVYEIYLMDPVFNLNAARAKEICRFIVEHNHRKIRFHAEVWAEFVDEEMARLFRDANFHYLEVGLQTIDDAVLATIERRLKLKQFLEGLGYLKKYGLGGELHLIYGLPGDTVASFRKSLNFAASLDFYCLMVFLLMVLPGTELWRKAKALKLEYDSEPPYVVRSHYSMTEEDIEYGRKVVASVEYLGYSWTVRLLSKEPGLTFADVMDEWIEWRETQSGREAQTRGDRITEFVLHVCEKRRISPEFYRASAAVEFRAEGVREPQSRVA